MRFLEIKVDGRIRTDSSVSQQRLAGSMSVSQDQSYFYVSSERVNAKIRKRSAPPQTYCQMVDERTVKLGYHTSGLAPNQEFLHIVLTHDGTVQVERDAFATLPVFYGNSGDVFVLSNEFEAVASTLPAVSLDYGRLAETLEPDPDSYETIWREIKILGERHTLTFANSACRLHLPSARPWQVSQDVPPSNASEYNQRFSHYLNGLLDAITGQDGIGFEVSGGLDSSLLPLYAAKTRPQYRGVVGTMNFPGRYRDTHHKKLQIIGDVTSWHVLSTDMVPEQDYPLVDIDVTSPQPLFYLRELYMRSTDRLARLFAEQGVHTIYSGSGGDDIMENTVSIERVLRYGASERERRSNYELVPYATDAMRRAYIASVPDKPASVLPLLPTSYLSANTAHNNLYIAHNIWPRSPYADAGLYMWCQGLPAHYRANKNIVRAFYEAYSLPPEIYRPVQNEDFSDFFKLAFTAGVYDNMVQSVAAHSVLARLGLIDMPQLLDSYQLYRHGGGTHPLGRFNIYLWLSIELSLRGMPRSTAIRW